MWSPCNLSTPSSTLPLKRGTNIPVCPSIATASDLHTALGRHVNQDSHTTSRDLKKSGQTSSIPGALLLSSWSTKFVASLPVRGHYSPSSTDSASITHILTLRLRRSLVCFFHHFTISSVEVSSVPRTVVLSVSRAPVPPSELSESLPELLWGRPKVFFHGLPKLLPHLIFRISHCQSWTPLSLQLPLQTHSLTKPNPSSA